MSKGVVIYAYNSAHDYVALAERSARLVKKHMNLPTTLITDQEVNSTAFEKVIVRERTDPEQLRVVNGVTSAWHNQNRYTVYELSPYDQTLLIDADYFVFSDVLNNIFKSDVDFACYDDVLELSGTQYLSRRLGDTSIPMQWATVVYFTKSPLAKGIFDFMSYIKKNYEFYAALYNFRPDMFRNDYALSIALQALTGYNTKNFATMPGKLFTIANEYVISIKPDSGISCVYVGKNGATMYTVKNSNIHFINKDVLFRPGFIEQLDEVINAPA